MAVVGSESSGPSEVRARAPAPTALRTDVGSKESEGSLGGAGEEALRPTPGRNAREVSRGGWNENSPWKQNILKLESGKLGENSPSRHGLGRTEWRSCTRLPSLITNPHLLHLERPAPASSTFWRSGGQAWSLPTAPYLNSPAPA